MIAYTGLDGSGKTYHMAEVCQNNIRAGIDCFGTTEFQGARLLENHRQLLRINNAHVFFDEWHQDHDAKQWFNLDPVLRHIITQHRKYNLVIHWSAQSFHFMDSFVRRETMFVWEHEALYRDQHTGRSKIKGRIPFIGKVDGLHRAIKYPAWEVEQKHRRPEVLAKRTFFIRENVYKTYDSYKKIMLTSKQVSDNEIQAIRDPYTAAVIRQVGKGSKVKAKRDVPAALLAAAQPPINGKSDLVAEQSSLDDHEQAESRIKLAERQENTDNLSTLLKVRDPSKKTSRQRASSRQEANQELEYIEDYA